MSTLPLLNAATSYSSPSLWPVTCDPRVPDLSLSTQRPVRRCGCRRRPTTASSCCAPECARPPCKPSRFALLTKQHCCECRRELLRLARAIAAGPFLPCRGHGLRLKRSANRANAAQLSKRRSAQRLSGTGASVCCGGRWRPHRAVPLHQLPLQLQHHDQCARPARRAGPRLRHWRGARLPLTAACQRTGPAGLRCYLLVYNADACHHASSMAAETVTVTENPCFRCGGKTSSACGFVSTASELLHLTAAPLVCSSCFPSRLCRCETGTI